MAVGFKFQEVFSITRFFSHRRSEQFWKQNNQTFLVLFSTSSSVWAAIESICFKGRSRFVASIISRVFWLIQKAASSPRCKLSFKSGLESWNFHQGNQNYWKVFILCTLYISGFSIWNLITSHFYNIKQILLDILHQAQVLWQVVRLSIFFKFFYIF